MNKFQIKEESLIDEKFERLKTLSPDYIFSSEDLNDVLRKPTRGNNNSKQKTKESVKWGIEWIRRRNDKPDYESYKLNLTLVEAFNELSNSQLLKWIEGRIRSSDSSLDRFERLNYLSPDHVFTLDDLSDVLKVPSNCRQSSLRRNKTEESVIWACTWLRRRNNKPKNPNYHNKLPLLDALNNTSNSQLLMWIEFRNAIIIEKFERLQFLHPDHHFTAFDLNDTLRVPSKDLSTAQRNKKIKESVEWGTEWLKRRNDKMTDLKNLVE